MFTLYARSGSGSTAVEALLAECGAPYRIENVSSETDGLAYQAYLQINPRGEVPSLRLPDDSSMTESAAMMIYLADSYPNAGLAPAVTSPLRASYLRWMIYFASAVYMADLRFYYPQRYSTEVAHADFIKAKATEHMDRDFAIFAAALGNRPYVLGETFSAVDIYAAMLLSWAPDLEALFSRHSNLKTFYRQVAGRPKIAPVWLRNEMPL